MKKFLKTKRQYWSNVITLYMGFWMKNSPTFIEQKQEIIHQFKNKLELERYSPETIKLYTHSLDKYISASLKPTQRTTDDFIKRFNH